MMNSINEKNYLLAINKIINNVSYYQIILQQYSIKYHEEINQEIFKKVIKKLGNSISIISHKVNDYLFIYTQQYIVKLFFLYPELGKIKKSLKDYKEYKSLYFQLKAFLKKAKNEKNSMYMKECAFDLTRCINIDNSCMMFIYSNGNIINQHTETLKQFIDNNELFSQGLMNEKTLKYLSYKLFKILSYGFKCDYLVQGDFSIDNIIIHQNTGKNDIEIKMIDFTCSTLIKQTGKIYNLQLLKGHVNECYQSPEYFSKINYVFRRNAHQCDIFSFGLILFYFATGQELLSGIENLSSNEEKQKYIKNQIKQIDSLLRKHNRSEECIAFIKSLLEYSNMERLNYHQIQQDKWIDEDFFLGGFIICSLFETTPKRDEFIAKKRERDDKNINKQKVDQGLHSTTKIGE